MYQDIRAKLEMLKNAPGGTVNRTVVPGMDVHEIINGRICTNDDGSYFEAENRYHRGYIHGGYSLGCVLDPRPLALKMLLPETGQHQGSCSDTGIQDFLFLDIETTGLSAGTGTVAFLTGIGYFEDDMFIIKQFFMRDYDEEPAVLKALNELIGNCRGFVTFNGKAFDWNLLQNRFIFNRIRPAVKNPLHIDLLYPCRRIWKFKLESCSLTSIEENILGEGRIDDVPGYMIPSVYFKYLDDRDATGIKRIMRHNETDILTMVSLMARISAILENPLAETDGGAELLGAGRILETGGNSSMGVFCYETCIKSENYMIKETASKRLTGIYKKNRDYVRATAHLDTMLADAEGCSISVMIEAAKLYEHREKNIDRAIDIVEKALRKSVKMGLQNSLPHDELKKRLVRLYRKRGKTT